jgi:hypothetical protein
MLTVRAACLVLGALAIGPLLPATAASAAETVPAVGQCYVLGYGQTADDYWPGATAVPCTSAHTFEVTRSSVLPADADAVTFAQQQCDYPLVWADLGINQPVNGRVRAPFRVEAFYFVVRSPGVQASYVCGAGAVAFHGGDPVTLVSLDSQIRLLPAVQRRALRFCSSADRGRNAFAEPITVPCSHRPRWQVTKWIQWSHFYDSYPGEAALLARAQQMCGPLSVPSVPSAAAWPQGTRRTWCYRKYP